MTITIDMSEMITYLELLGTSQAGIYANISDATSLIMTGIGVIVGAICGNAFLSQWNLS